MTRILFGIFAHPDDEAFGPSGTLIKEARDGTDVHLLCMTRGETGRNVDGHGDLGAVRMKDWQTAGKLIGVASMQQFGYGDGALCNNLYHEIAGKVESHVENILASYEESVEIHFMTFDPSGLTGHIDHITVSLVSTFSFLRLQRAHPGWRLTRLRYFCVPAVDALVNDVSYLYMPPGRTPEECDEVINVSEVFKEKLAVMRAHRSQRDDMNWLLDIRGDTLKSERFRYLK